MTTPCPKPVPPRVDRLARQRARRLTEQLFRTAVWVRDQGRCRVCGIRVRKSLDVLRNRGEVHHLRGRNVAPADRTNPDRAVLVCLVCHVRLTRHDPTAVAALIVHSPDSSSS